MGWQVIGGWACLILAVVWFLVWLPGFTRNAGEWAERSAQAWADDETREINRNAET